MQRDEFGSIRQGDFRVLGLDWTATERALIEPSGYYAAWREPDRPKHPGSLSDGAVKTTDPTTADTSTAGQTESWLK